MSEDAGRLEEILEASRSIDGPIVLLTGAGISAESGIPTFRGEEGYWTVGSKNYHPMELATWEAFSQMPDEVWAWYLYRRSVCRGAEPNAGHVAIAELEKKLGDRFVLITQNVDGLHLRAGSTPERTFQIHGNIDFMRCADDCRTDLHPIPDEVDPKWEKGRGMDAVTRELLLCPACGTRARPHVLWFDEYYDEEHFRFESSLAVAARASVLLVVGTTGRTNLPLHVGSIVARRGAPMLFVNPEPTPFTDMVEVNPNGLYLEGTAAQHLPTLLGALNSL
ncbi:MAG: RNA polymerase subunit sigma, partial [Actinobacteria bacterium]|nr:RNA polymerase subunit sigma [Actinomycetota bacterium]NIX21017.1 RNA polymerase subunit sigma [Actinomycetota bacterium]